MRDPRPGGSRWLALILVGPATALLCLFFLAPLWRALRVSLTSAGGVLTPAAYAYIAQSWGLWADLGFTLASALGALLPCVVIALPVSLLLRETFPGHRALRVAVLFPLVVPHLIAAYSLRLALAPSGPIFGTLAGLPFLPDPPQLVNHWTGLVVALTWKFFPVMALTLSAALETIPTSLEEAARDLGAGPWRRLVEILLPLLVPAMVSGGALIFIMASAQFSITLVIYGSPGLTTIPMDIYTEAFGLSRWDVASALGIVLTLVTLGLLALAVAVVRRATRVALGTP
jgi:ABC-type spermidine/putrescine transport system permease subunit I